MKKLAFAGLIAVVAVAFLSRDALLLRGARNGQKLLIEIALALRASPNAFAEDGDTPLIAAASAGNTAVVKRLIDGRADVNLGNHQTGTTPLMAAAQRGDAAMVDVLLAAGAVNVRDNHGRTARNYAWEKNYFDLARTLQNVPEPRVVETAPPVRPASLFAPILVPSATQPDIPPLPPIATSEQTKKNVEATKKLMEETQKKGKPRIIKQVP